MSPHAALASARQRQGASLDLLARLVETNTHADNAAGIARCHAMLTPELTALGFAVDLVDASGPHPRDGRGVTTRRHLLARRPHTAGRPTVLLMGHLDTVFAPDDPFQSLVRGSDTWNGPGVSDMKGGIVTALAALGILAEEGALDDANFRLVLASDEEQGSPTALPVLRQAAAGADVALCFEAARPCGGLVVARRGYGAARIEVRGTSGHAGIAHDTGVNAFTSLARVVVAAEALEGNYPELSVSPGGAVRVSPASVTAIPDHAECELEWRFVLPGAGEAFLADLRARAEREARASGARVEVVGGVECPPMAATTRSVRVLQRYVEAARELGMPVQGVSTAGVGDINLVAQMGATCLDGVGPEGGAFHTPGEYVVVASIARRAAMNAAAITRYLADLREH